jgi:hypothetical protein
LHANLTLMHTEPSFRRRRQISRAADIAMAIAGVIAAVLRSVLRAVLALLEPIVRPTLCAIALLASATALFFRFAVGDPAFPFWGMVGLSVACMLLLDLYYRLARMFGVRA